MTKETVTKEQDVAELNRILPCTFENIQRVHTLLFAPWVKQQKLDFLKVEEGRIKARHFQDTEQQFLSGAMCGQATMSAIDTVMSLAMLTYRKQLKGTVSQNNQFLRPALGDDLIIESTIIKVGKIFAYGETRVTFETSGKMVVHSTSQFAF